MPEVSVYSFVHFFHPQTCLEHLPCTPTFCTERCWGPRSDPDGTRPCPCMQSAESAENTLIRPCIVGTQHCGLLLQSITSRALPRRLTLKGLPRGLQVLATLLLSNATPSMTPSHISSKQNESCRLLFPSHSPLKRVWGAQMKLLMWERRVLFLRNDLKTRCHFLPTKLKTKITQPKQEAQGSALSPRAGGSVSASQTHLKNDMIMWY